MMMITRYNLRENDEAVIRTVQVSKLLKLCFTGRDVKLLFFLHSSILVKCSSIQLRIFWLFLGTNGENLFDYSSIAIVLRVEKVWQFEVSGWRELCESKESEMRICNSWANEWSRRELVRNWTTSPDEQGERLSPLNSRCLDWRKKTCFTLSTKGRKQEWVSERDGERCGKKMRERREPQREPSFFSSLRDSLLWFSCLSPILVPHVSSDAKGRKMCLLKCEQKERIPERYNSENESDGKEDEKEIILPWSPISILSLSLFFITFMIIQREVFSLCSSSELSPTILFHPLLTGCKTRRKIRNRVSMGRIYLFKYFNRCGLVQFLSFPSSSSKIWGRKREEWKKVSSLLALSFLSLSHESGVGKLLSK